MDNSHKLTVPAGMQEENVLFRFKKQVECLAEDCVQACTSHTVLCHWIRAVTSSQHPPPTYLQVGFDVTYKNSPEEAQGSLCLDRYDICGSLQATTNAISSKHGPQGRSDDVAANACLPSRVGGRWRSTACRHLMTLIIRLASCSQECSHRTHSASAACVLFFFFFLACDGM